MRAISQILSCQKVLGWDLRMPGYWRACWKTTKKRLPTANIVDAINNARIYLTLHNIDHADITDTNFDTYFEVI